MEREYFSRSTKTDIAVEDVDTPSSRRPKKANDGKSFWKSDTQIVPIDF